MQIIRKDHDETQQKRLNRSKRHLKAHMKTPGKSALVVMMAAVYVLFASGVTGIGNLEDQTVQSVSAMPTNMRELTDETVDTFALVYSMKILHTQEYMLTMENREKIKRLISNLGADNIEKLNEAIYSGNADQIIETVIQLVDENFGWEETALMGQWQ